MGRKKVIKKSARQGDQIKNNGPTTSHHGAHGTKLKGEASANWKWHLIIVLSLIVVTFIAYLPALDNEFVDWDDTAYVLDNDLVRQKSSQTTVADVFTRPVSLNYHPLTILSM